MNEKTEKLAELVRHFKRAMLVTRSVDGSFKARPMEIADVVEEAELHFITSVESEKVREIRLDPHVGVALQADRRYLMINGTATIERDPERARSVWSEAWRPWFPDGPEDPQLVFIHLRPAKAEYWDRSGINELKLVFEAARSVLNGDEPQADATQHGEVQF